jgi:hypothetical protein
VRRASLSERQYLNSTGAKVRCSSPNAMRIWATWLHYCCKIAWLLKNSVIGLILCGLGECH